MIIFGSTLSPYVRKTAAFASEKGLEFEIKPTGLGSPDPDFCAASPFRKMPAFQDGDYRLCDSTAICHYLEAKYPDRPLIPAEPEARGRTIWYDEFADTILVACGAKVFFNRIVAPRFLGRPGDEAAAETVLREELPPILDYLEKVVPDPGGYLVGDALTLADLAVASPFANFFHLNVELDSERHPRTRAYTESILARPSFRPFIEKEAALLERTAA